MKTRTWMNAIGIGTFLLTSFFAMAGEKGGNGGLGNEAAFSNVAGEVLDWVNKNKDLGKLDEKLNLKTQGINAEQFSKKLNDAIEHVHVLFDDEPTEINGHPRACINLLEQNLIHCNNDLWKKTEGQVRYALAFHEYLGILAYEKNDEEDYSRYPISSKILSYVFVSQKYELGIERADSGLSALVGEYVKVSGDRLCPAKLSIQRDTDSSLLIDGKVEKIGSFKYGSGGVVCNDVTRTISFVGGAFKILDSRMCKDDDNFWSNFAIKTARVYDLRVYRPISPTHIQYFKGFYPGSSHIDDTTNCTLERQ